MEGLQTNITGAELAKLKSQVNTHNKSLGKVDGGNKGMGKDDFMQILITQLSHQDPTNPMKDKEFIAQMAQFSSLEQMTNMSKQFSKLSGVLQSDQALSMLGKNVTVMDSAGNQVTGKVQAVSGGETPQIQVEDQLYDINQIEKVTE